MLLWDPLVNGAGPLAEAAELLDESSREAAQRLAAEGAEHARAAGFDADPLSVSVARRRWRTLLELAEQRQARMILVGSHGWGAADVALGTVADRVTTHAATPVLILPACGAPDRAASARAPRAPRD